MSTTCIKQQKMFGTEKEKLLGHKRVKASTLTSGRLEFISQLNLPVTSKFAVKWLSCQVPGIVGLVL